MQRNCCVYGACLYSLYLSLFKSIPEVTFNGQWSAKKISDNIVNLIEMGLCVQGIVTDHKCVFSTNENNPLIPGGKKRSNTHT